MDNKKNEDIKEALFRLLDIEDPLEFKARLQILPLSRDDRVKQYVRYCKVRGKDINVDIIKSLWGEGDASRAG